MPSIKDLKKRIGTVKNTQQTTKAMKMVSAAKLRRAQDAINAQRPYARAIDDLIRRLVGHPEVKTSSPLLGREASAEGKKLLIVLVTSERGLCGAFNSNVIKTGQRWLRENQGKYASVEFGFLGRKGFEFFRNKPVKSGPYFNDLGGKVTFAKAKKLADSIVQPFIEGQYDEVKFIYNEFKNAVSQKVVVENFLPLTPPESPKASDKDEGAGVDSIIRPGAGEVLEMLLSKQFATQAFRIMLESQAGEHGARMSSMENATKNAGEMIKKLSLQYNKQRQAGITKELLEIISGSESQKGA